MHCIDKSDEIACQKIRFDQAYLSSLPPPNLVEGKKKWMYVIIYPTGFYPILDFKGNQKVPLDIDIVIESILDINEVQSLMQIQFEVILTWIDPRLEYVNLKTSLNLLSEDEKSQLWLPSLTFPNTKEKMTTSFDDNNSTGVIKIIEGYKGAKSPLHNVKNEIKFKGKER